MSQKPYVYALVRIRKSGSQSLVEMVTAALPESRIMAMPPVPPVADLGSGIFEDFRRVRRTKKRLWKLFKLLSYPKAWEHLNATLNQGDIVSGHFGHGAPALPAWDLRYITMVREPVSRLYSEYRYCRQSYLARPAWRRGYLAKRLKVAGKGTFRDYVAYLCSHAEVFANPLVGYVTSGANVGDPYEFLRSNYFHYGTLERMDLFADGLAAKLGRPIDPVWKNKTEKVLAVDPGACDPAQLEILLGKDLALYRAICAEHPA